MEALLGWSVIGWVVGLSGPLGPALVALGDYRLAKVSFSVCAVTLAGKLAYGSWSADATPTVALRLFAGVIGIGVVLIVCFRWVDAKRIAAVAAPAQLQDTAIAPVPSPVIVASDYPHLIADTRAHFEAKLKEQQEMNKSLRSALHQCHGALDAGVKSGQGLQQEIVKITKERDGLKESRVAQQLNDGQVRQLRLALETTKLDLQNLQNVTRYGEPKLSALPELSDSGLKFLQGDMRDLTTWIKDAHNGVELLRHKLLVEMFEKGEADTAHHLASLIHEVEDPITDRIMARFFEEATVGKDSREALAAACSSYARRKTQLNVLAGYLNRSVESLEGYSAWRESDKKYEEVLRGKLETPSLNAVKIWGSSSANGGELGSWILSE
jgi:hypothetical protein